MICHPQVLRGNLCSPVRFCCSCSRSHCVQRHRAVVGQGYVGLDLPVLGLELFLQTWCGAGQRPSDRWKGCLGKSQSSRQQDYQAQLILLSLWLWGVCQHRLLPPISSLSPLRPEVMAKKKLLIWETPCPRSLHIKPTISLFWTRPGQTGLWCGKRKLLVCLEERQ